MSKQQPKCRVESDGYSLDSDSAILDPHIHLRRDVFDKLRLKAMSKGMDVDEYVAKEIIEKRLKELPEMKANERDSA